MRLIIHIKIDIILPIIILTNTILYRISINNYHYLMINKDHLYINKILSYKIQKLENHIKLIVKTLITLMTLINLKSLMTLITLILNKI